MAGDGAGADELAEHELLRQALGDPATGARRERDLERVAVAYMWAAVRGQIFEYCCKLAEGALRAPVEDDHAAASVVEAALRHRLFDALAAIARLAPATVSPELHERMDRGRRRRNHLAHEWAWDAMVLVLRGKADEVISALEEDEALFTGVIDEIFAAIYEPAIGARGVTLAEVRRFSDVALMAMAAVPDQFDGIALPVDAEELAQRLLSIVQPSDVDSSPDDERPGR